MSSRDSGSACALTIRRPARLAGSVFVLAAAVLAGCGDSGFRPLYGPNAAGVLTSERIKEVDFAPIPGRVGQRVRNALVFESTGGGNAAPPQYRFEWCCRRTSPRPW
jgi:LPS-assembly lipoprotein